MDNILSIHSISKSFGPVKALENVSLEVKRGSVYGILGPNGSGKTTLLSIVLGVNHENEGSFSWFGGEDAESARKRTGALLETPNFYHYLSGYENLKIAAKIKAKDNADLDSILKTVGLYERKDSAFSGYSLGMKQRLAIGSALIGDPEVLVLDEPTNGLDPAGIAEVRELIRDLYKQGKTIILASHLLDEVEKVCTEVAILKRGHVLEQGSVANALGTESLLQLNAENLEHLRTVLSGYSGIKNITIENNHLIAAHDGSIKAADLNKWLGQQGIYLSLLTEKKKNLEAIFIELTKNN